MHVEYLSFVRIGTRPVSVTTAVFPIIGHHNELKHVIVKCKRHLIKRLDILVECWNGKNIRLVSKVGGQPY